MKLWIARDRDGRLYLHDFRPIKDIETYHTMGPYTHKIEIENDNFPEVTFENSPQEVELKLVK